MCGGKCCVESGDFLYLMRAQRPVMFIHPPPHTTSLFSLPTFFSRISSALSTPSRPLSLLLSARSGPEVVWVELWAGEGKTASSGEGERKPICGQVWISFPFYGKSSTMGGMIPKLIFSREGGTNTPRKSIFIFNC